MGSGGTRSPLKHSPYSEIEMTNIEISIQEEQIHEFMAEHLDAMNFEGYTDMILRERPQLYNFEKEQFIRMHCEPLINRSKSLKR